MPTIYGLNFENLWDCRPQSEENRRVIVKSYEVGGDGYKEKTIYRYFQSFGVTPGFDENTGKSFMFSGSRVPYRNYSKIPTILSEVHQFVGHMYNNVIVNWYEPEDYIEPHRDCTSKLVKNSSIVIVNFNEPRTEADRFFSLEYADRIEQISLENYTVISMDHNTQKEAKHGVGRGNHRRISVSFRRIEEE